MLPVLDSFLRTAAQDGCRWVRVVHGKGSGVLKLEVERRLASHPLVRSYRQADRWHGGSGATDVQLRIP